MAELRHSWSMGNRTAAISSSSPAKRDSFANSKPLFSSSDNAGECHRSWYLFFHRSSSLIRSALESPRGLWILIAFGGFLIFLGFMFMLAAWSQLSGPYLCYKDEINLQCPRVNEARLLWENPHASTTSWKPCAEWRENGISDLLPENETSAYIFIHAEGGLNQQRIAMSDQLGDAFISLLLLS